MDCALLLIAMEILQNLNAMVFIHLFVSEDQSSTAQTAVSIMEIAEVPYASVIRVGLERTVLSFTATTCTTVLVTVNVWVLTHASAIPDIWVLAAHIPSAKSSKVVLIV